VEGSGAQQQVVTEPQGLHQCSGAVAAGKLQQAVEGVGREHAQQRRHEDPVRPGTNADADDQPQGNGEHRQVHHRERERRHPDDGRRIGGMHQWAQEVDPGQDRRADRQDRTVHERSGVAPGRAPADEQGQAEQEGRVMGQVEHF
jgi:hypothetical protein